MKKILNTNNQGYREWHQYATIMNPFFKIPIKCFSLKFNNPSAKPSKFPTLKIQQNHARIHQG